MDTCQRSSVLEQCSRKTLPCAGNSIQHFSGPTGKIIGKNLRGPDLDTKLCEILGCDTKAKPFNQIYFLFPSVLLLLSLCCGAPFKFLSNIGQYLAAIATIQRRGVAIATSLRRREK
jgi:hypothetical protein